MRALRRFCIGIFALCGLIGAAPAGNAAEWPVRVVKVVVPFAAGGATDVLTRLLWQRLSSDLNATFVVENRGAAPAAISAARWSRLRRTTATHS
jgi:tripartite-type tricarboxylate transporter receptor subunit TctC